MCTEGNPRDSKLKNKYKNKILHWAKVPKPKLTITATFSGLSNKTKAACTAGSWDYKQDWERLHSFLPWIWAVWRGTGKVCIIIQNSILLDTGRKSTDVLASAPNALK